jgi:hypothetical protein
MLFDFVGRVEDSVCPGVAVDYFPRQWVGELHVMCVVHLFILQVYASSFGTGQREKWHATFLTVGV